MILSTFSDHFQLSISVRLRVIFVFYGLVSAAAAALAFTKGNMVTDFDFVYQLIFPIAVLSCFAMAIHPEIGNGSLYLLPLFLGSFIRVTDLWVNYFQEDISLETATRGSIGWTFLLISIAYVDLLESRIYHRMVNYIEQEAN